MKQPSLGYRCQLLSRQTYTSKQGTVDAITIRGLTLMNVRNLYSEIPC